MNFNPDRVAKIQLMRTRGTEPADQPPKPPQARPWRPPISKRELRETQERAFANTPQQILERLTKRGRHE